MPTCHSVDFVSTMGRELISALHTQAEPTAFTLTPLAADPPQTLFEILSSCLTGSLQNALSSFRRHQIFPLGLEKSTLSNPDTSSDFESTLGELPSDVGGVAELASTDGIFVEAAALAAREGVSFVGEAPGLTAPSLGSNIPNKLPTKIPAQPAPAANTEAYSEVG